MVDASPSRLEQSLGALLELARRARQARSEAELGFLLVNDSVALAPYRQGALWDERRGLKTLSGLVQPEANAPYAQWLKAVCEHLHGQADTGAPRTVTAADLPAPLGAEWADWWPAQALWVPVPSPAATSSSASTHTAVRAPSPSAWLLARDEAWTPAEQALLQEWAATWAHALAALQNARPRRLWRPWGRDTAGALPQERRWWRRPWVWAALAVAVAAAVPVRLSVLAPGELVPVNPVVVRAPLDGVVDVFHVQPNQRVKKGDPLFGFDEALIQSRLEVAQQALATAGTEYRQTMQQALSDPRVRPQLAALNGRIQERRAEVAFLREQLTRARVLAPQDGVAMFDDPSEWIGKPVSVGERILRLAALTDVEVEAWLPIADAIALQPDAPVQLYLNASPLEPVNARLRYLAHDAVQRPDGSYAYRVRATLVSPTAHRVGLKGTAKVQGERVPAIYWVLRRPLATLRSTLGL